MPDVFSLYPPQGGPSAGSSATPPQAMASAQSSGGVNLSSTYASIFWALALFAASVTILHVRRLE